MSATFAHSKRVAEKQQKGFGFNFVMEQRPRYWFEFKEFREFSPEDDFETIDAINDLLNTASGPNEKTITEKLIEQRTDPRFFIFVMLCNDKPFAAKEFYVLEYPTLKYLHPVRNACYSKSREAREFVKANKESAAVALHKRFMGFGKKLGIDRWVLGGGPTEGLTPDGQRFYERLVALGLCHKEGIFWVMGPQKPKESKTKLPKRKIVNRLPRPKRLS
jgi:hypothetical protein